MARSTAAIRLPGSAVRASAGVAREVERGAVIDRRARKRQAERHVDAVAEARRLEHRQSLVVIHRDDRVVAARVLGDEHRVGGQRAGDASNRCRARVGDRRRDDVDLLAPEMAALAGVRIEAAHGDARRARCRTCDAVRAPTMTSVSATRVARDRGGHVLQRQMRGDERDAQRRIGRAADQQHHDARRVRALGEEFGVARERDARVHDHALLHRRGDERGERAGRAGVGRVFEHREHAVRVGGVGLPGRDRRGERLMPDFDDAARGRERQRIEFARSAARAPMRAARSASSARSPTMTRRAANGVLGVAHREHRAQFGTDARGLARR